MASDGLWDKVCFYTCRCDFKRQQQVQKEKTSSGHDQLYFVGILQVNEQEAVDVILKDNNNSVESCKKLVDMSFGRGNMDDITVMVINLQNFVTNGC